MSEQYTPGRLTRFILDKPLSDIPAYVDQCIKASGGKDFYFLSADCPDKGQVDIAHIGNGPRGEANARRLVACWNASEGIDTEDLEAGSVNIIDKLHDDAARRVMAQRDELLGFAKEWLSRQGTDDNYMTAKAKAAIAKATGESNA